MENGEANPAKIMNILLMKLNIKWWQNFSVSPIRANLDLAEQEKAINDAVLKIKKESLDKKAAEASDIAQLQQIIKEQSMLQKIHVSLN